MYRNKEAGKNTISPNMFDRDQIEAICEVTTNAYIEMRLEEGQATTQIDIEKLVKEQLGCDIVYENITDDEDCIGFAADGRESLRVIRDGQEVEVVFPKDTIVIDKYLNEPGQINRKRFTIGHEAGHVIKARVFGSRGGHYCHSGSGVLNNPRELKKRFSASEPEANNFAAGLLMPKCLVDLLMDKFYGDQKIVKYPNNILDGYDADNIRAMATILGVSYTAMFIRLKTLGHVVDGDLDTYMEDIVFGDSDHERS